MGTLFFASYLIGLRDGLEAALVISILVAFLNRSSRRDRLREVWVGVGAAVLVSAGVGVLLTTVAGWLGSGVRLELFEAVTSLVAVTLVTWMIFWMRRTARTLKGELTGRLETALSMGGWAVVTMAFFAVLREGVEMVLLVFAAAEGATDSAAPLLGMLAGITSAVGLGWVITTAAVRINLGRFFTWTGALLILVAAGILKYGVHGLQSAGMLPGDSQTAFDLSATIDPTSWYATLLAGTVNLTPHASVLEITAWLLFAVIMLALFFRPSPRPAVRVRTNTFVAAGTVVALGLTPVGCGGRAGSAPAASADGAITVTATDTGCALSADHMPSGQHTFAVTEARYPVARTSYERIETVAETVGDLDPGIDARDGDLDPSVEWTGYHRIEQQLWNGGDLAAVTPVADRLLADVRLLRQRLDGVTLTALELANGAKSLLDEVATKKVTGEEDRYSHTDLWDFAANVDGCRAAIAALRPVLDARQPDLGPRLGARFAAVDAELAKYRQGDGCVAYTTLQPNQVQLLSGAVNALGEQVSAVPAAIVHR